MSAPGLAIHQDVVAAVHWDDFSVFTDLNLVARLSVNCGGHFRLFGFGSSTKFTYGKLCAR